MIRGLGLFIAAGMLTLLLRIHVLGQLEFTDVAQPAPPTPALNAQVIADQVIADQDGADQEIAQAAAPPAVPTVGSTERYVILEVAFIKELFKLSESQKSRLEKITVNSLLNTQPKNNRAVNKLFQKAEASPIPDALRNRRITRAFEKEVSEILEPAQLEIYQKEVKLRQEFRVDASVTRLLAVIDSKLTLSDEQKVQLKGKLQAWSKVTEIPLHVYESNEAYLPQLPGDLLKPILNTKQLEIFEATQQVDFGGDGGFEWILGQVLIDH